MKVAFAPNLDLKASALVVGIFDDLSLTSSAKNLNEIMGGGLSKALKSNRFKGKVGQTLMINAPNGLDANHLLLVGLGKKGEIDYKDAELIGASITNPLLATPETSAVFCVAGVASSSLSTAEIAAHVGLGARLKRWRFDKYFTKKTEDEKPQLKALTVATESAKEAETVYVSLECLAEGVDLTRDLVAEVPNVLQPESYAERIQELEKDGLKIEVLGEAEMKKLGMNALLGVGQGSDFESKLVVMRWNGADNPDDAPLAFVGKGVTFDTGGISLKPSAAMDEMRGDMGGSAVVVGLMKTLARRKAKTNVVGVVGLVENMPCGKAQRPGDIVKSLSGQTIEILNTDAEGRLVLADALWYTQDRFKPKLMINLATLTGAIVIALGHEYAGVFSNNDELCENLMKASAKTDEKVWRFPLHKNFDKDIDSPVADMKNLGNGRAAGSITAAQFLQRFVNDTPWAHIDIAGVTLVTGRDFPLSDKTISGYGVRLLNTFVQDHYEV